MPTRKRTILALAALPLPALATTLVASAPAMPASSATPAVYLPYLARHAAPPPTPTPTATASPTATITPTATPPFADKVNIIQSHKWMSGWDWPANAQVTLDLTSSTGAPIEQLLLVADGQGRIPQAWFQKQPLEGDWVTLTMDGVQAMFPIRLVTATGDYRNDTIEGVALPYAGIRAGACHADQCWGLDSQAGDDGRFRLDFSSTVDWEWDDFVTVGQWVSAVGCVQVVAGSPEFTVITPTPTASPTRTATPTPTATPSHDGPPYIHIATPSGSLFAGRTYTEARYRVIATLFWFRGAMEWLIQMRNPPYVPPGVTMAPDIRDQPVEKAMRFWFTELDGSE